MNYQRLAEEIVSAVGGKENIKNAVHCATRLRLSLKDENLADDTKVESLNGVYGIAKKGGLYQIIIGSSVGKVYKETIKLCEFTESPEILDNRKVSIKRILNGIFGYISSVGGGLAVPLIATGMIKVILTVLSMFGWMSVESQTYQMLLFVSDCCFYFLPVMVAIGAARKLGTDLYMSILVSLMVLHPTFIQYVSEGAPLNFLGLPVTLTNYSNTFMPMLITIYVLYWVEKGINKVIPDGARFLIAPVVTLLIMIPITFAITGPVGYIIGKSLADFFLFIQSNVGYIFTGILAMCLPLLILCGLHQSLGSVFISTYFATYGYDGPWGPANLCVNIAVLSTCLAISLTTKEMKTKQLSVSAGLTAGLGGITEPAIFGILTKNKFYLVATCLSAGIGGVCAGILGLKRFVIASPNLLSLPVFIGEGSSIIIAIIVCIITAVISFVFVYIISKLENKKLEQWNLEKEG